MSGMENKVKSQPGLAGLGNTALIEKLIVLLLFFAFLAGVLMVLLPFGIGLLFGAIIAISTWPLREWMRRRGLSPFMSATLLLLLLLAFVAVPVLLLAPRMAGDLTRVLDVCEPGCRRAPRHPAGWTLFPSWATP